MPDQVVNLFICWKGDCGRFWDATMWKMVLLRLMCIWRERNDRCFENCEWTMGNLKDIFFKVLYLWTTAFGSMVGFGMLLCGRWFCCALCVFGGKEMIDVLKTVNGQLHLALIFLVFTFFLSFSSSSLVFLLYTSCVRGSYLLHFFYKLRLLIKKIC
jgi:hypothetical protein